MGGQISSSLVLVLVLARSPRQTARLNLPSSSPLDPIGQTLVSSRQMLIAASNARTRMKWRPIFGSKVGPQSTSGRRAVALPTGCCSSCFVLRASCEGQTVCNACAHLLPSIFLERNFSPALQLVASSKKTPRHCPCKSCETSALTNSSIGPQDCSPFPKSHKELQTLAGLSNG